MKRSQKYLAITLTALLAAAFVVPAGASDPAAVITAGFTETDYDAMTALGESVTVWAEPGKEEIGTIADGELVHVSREWYDANENVTWCFITCGDISGWVLLSVLDLDFPAEGYVRVEEMWEEEVEMLYAPSAVETGLYDMAVESEAAYNGSMAKEAYWEPTELYPYIPFPDGETYEEYEETGFQLVESAPLSTFSAAVDTASYANIRRMIMDGYGVLQIPEDAVRAEEFVNYFSYDFDKPEDGEMFSASVEASVCPWNESHNLLMIGIRAKDENVKEIRQNLVFLVDISGSMWSNDKLPLAKKGMLKLLDTLTPEDTISIVTYASGEDLVLDGVHTTERNLGHIKYLILYLASGIGGNVVSVLYDHAMGVNIYSVGASGAVFGVMGVLMLLIIKGRRKIQRGSSMLVRAGFALFYAVYSGFRNPYTDNAAHLGGLAVGVLLGLILTLGMEDVDLQDLR